MPDIGVFHPQIVHFVIALFYVGLVFFRKNQPKQHFWLRT